MSNIRALRFFDVEDREELMLTEFEEGVSLAFIELLQIENIFIERDRFFDVIHFNRDMIAAVNLDPVLVRAAHFRNRSKALIISMLRTRISLRCAVASSSMVFSPLAVS